jgi:gamma-glutamylcyclotransferase (GGCT)/AIG2-like uncharacterized protein YtfP
MEKYLFVYGTLLDERNEFAVYLKKNCSFYCGGKFKGMLYDIGEYPGAIFTSKSNQYVYGVIFRLNDAVSALKMLDDYEGFGIAKPAPNEFIRDLIEIETDLGPVKCWGYLYNLPVNGLWQIESGNYLEYIKVN